MQEKQPKRKYPLPHVQGVILAGGKSSRIGYDKAMLTLDEACPIPLLQRVTRCAESVLGNVAISGREVQGYKSISDSIRESGPLSGIISALESFPNRAIFVLPCDLPFLIEQIITKLLLFRKKQPEGTLVTAYCQQAGRKIEPLIAIYEPQALYLLKKSLEKKMYKLQCALPRESQFLLAYTIKDSLPFFNINYPEDIEKAKRILSQSK